MMKSHMITGGGGIRLHFVEREKGVALSYPGFCGHQVKSH